MIKKNETQFERIIEAKCDSCGNNIKVDMVGRLEDHLLIGGYKNGKILEAIVCIPCVKEKMSFINIQERNNTVGYC